MSEWIIEKERANEWVEKREKYNVSELMSEKEREA